MKGLTKHFTEGEKRWRERFDETFHGEQKRVLVLLSTYNGEKYLAKLLDSVERQKGVEVDVLARDDGSEDGTVKILEDYAEKYGNLEIIRGKNLGYAKSFWELLKRGKGHDFYAFCDQDDVWEEEKLARAVGKIKKIKEVGPALYTSVVRSVDLEGRILSENTFGVDHVLSVYEAFQKSTIPGCVMVFNEVARELAARFDGHFESHDWALYAITRTFGEVILDDKSYIRYLVHGDNAIGANNKARELMTKIGRLFKKKKRTRSRFAKDFWKTYGGAEETARKRPEGVRDEGQIRISTEKVARKAKEGARSEEREGKSKWQKGRGEIPEEYAESIYNLAFYRENFKGKWRLFCDKNYKGLIFKIYTLFGII